MAIINTEFRTAMLAELETWIGEATGPTLDARVNFVNAMADVIAEYHNLDAGQDLWDDEKVTIEQASGGAALTSVVLGDTPCTIKAFSSSTDDEMTFYTQMPHRWNKATSVKPHIHWSPIILPAINRTVVFSGRYTWWDPLQPLPAWASWTSFTVTAAIYSTDHLHHLITPIATVAPSANAAASSHLIVHLVRQATHGSDNYTDGAANVAVLSVDTHYQGNRLGTTAEYGE